MKINSQRIRLRMIEIGINGKELSKKANISANCLSICLKKNFASGTVIHKLAKALEIPIKEIVILE